MTPLDPDGVRKLKRDLEELKVGLREACSPGRLDFGKAKRNLQVLENLERQVDTLIKLTKTKLKLQLVFAQRDSALKSIEAHEIKDQKILPVVSSTWRREYQQRFISFEQESVTTCYRSGRTGGLPVIYVTYSSASTIGAEKCIRQDLDVYSQCL
ncbi:hypothetical protein FRC08_008798 [Ceratobasidium sp. 394]|nr:hypothetical protein FRC08_008798 [Ceratobasidium sp. 394]